MIPAWNARPWRCKLCGQRINRNQRKQHIKASVVVDGRNICIGMKEHPRHKINESKKASIKKGFRFLSTHALPNTHGATGGLSWHASTRRAR